MRRPFIKVACVWESHVPSAHAQPRQLIPNRSQVSSDGAGTSSAKLPESFDACEDTAAIYLFRPKFGAAVSDRACRVWVEEAVVLYG